MSTNEAQTHEEILRKYNPSGQPWWQIPDDGYLYDHLAHHLHGAGRLEELYTLLTASPEWMEVRCHGSSNCTPLLNDIDLAMKDFTDLLDANRMLMLIRLHTAWQVAHARQNAYQDRELKILVWLDRKGEALNYARWQTEPEGQCRRLLTVYDTLRAKGQTDNTLLDEVYNLTSCQ